MGIDETSRKKKQLNEAEIALRREETARKRKHLSEKKLEDEKVRIRFSYPSSFVVQHMRLLLKGGNDQPSPQEEVGHAKQAQPACQCGRPHACDPHRQRHTSGGRGRRRGERRVYSPAGDRSRPNELPVDLNIAALPRGASRRQDATLLLGPHVLTADIAPATVRP
jgi:hypothetical protein